MKDKNLVIEKIRAQYTESVPTDLDNLTLLCRRHHSDNDDTRADPRRGHMTPRSDDARGRTGWAFPAGVDGTRKVRFNGAGGVAA